MTLTNKKLFSLFLCGLIFGTQISIHRYKSQHCYKQRLTDVSQYENELNDDRNRANCRNVTYTECMSNNKKCAV